MKLICLFVLLAVSAKMDGCLCCCEFCKADDCMDRPDKCCQNGNAPCNVANCGVLDPDQCYGCPMMNNIVGFVSGFMQGTIGKGDQASITGCLTDTNFTIQAYYQRSLWTMESFWNAKDPKYIFLGV